MVNETVAELAKIKVNDPARYKGKEPGLRVWRAFHRSILLAYRHIKWGQSKQGLVKRKRATVFIQRSLLGNVVYLDEDFNIVPQEQAVLAKIFYSDGRVVFGRPVRQVRDAGEEKSRVGDFYQTPV